MTSKKAAAKPKRSFDDFRAAHDKSVIVPAKIQAALDALGPDGWEYEVQLIRDAGLSTTDFAMFREQFEGYYVMVGGQRGGKRVWAGSKALAAKMRDVS